MAKVGVWIAGIIATVIAGYGVWYLTRPPAATTVEGMVYTGGSPVAKAMVELTLTGDAESTGPLHNETDENGAYRFEFTGLPKSAGAVLRVTASGYRTSPDALLRSPLGPDVHQDVAMIPQSVVRQPGGPVFEHPSTSAPKPHYVPKSLDSATRVKLQH